MKREHSPDRSPRLPRRALLRGLASAMTLAPVFSSLAPRAFAKAAPAAELGPDDLAALKRVETYLSGIKTLKARFQQYSEDGGIAFGTIYLQRPWRMRVEYEPPVPILLVADGSNVTYYDAEVDQVSTAPISSTPAWFLLRDPVSLSDSKVTVTQLERSPGALRIAMYQTEEPDAGSVTLILTDQPTELKQWTVHDASGKEIRVGLFGASIGLDLDRKLFEKPKTRRQLRGWQ